MATVSFQFAAAQQPLDQGFAEVSISPGPQTNTVQPHVAAIQQDAVNIVGRTAETQLSQNSGGSAASVAGAYFSAERQTFRAANGSAQSQAAQTMPVHIKDQSILSGTEVPTQSTDPAQNQNELAGSGSATLAMTSVGLTAQNSDPADASSTGSSNPVKATPQEQLQQLDQTLQEIGVDPQSISLFNRMAMLLYASDPAALKVLVQAMQNVAPQLSGGSTSTSNNTQTSLTVQGALGAATQPPSARQSQLATTQNSTLGEANYQEVSSNAAPENSQTSQSQTAALAASVTQAANSNPTQTLRPSLDIQNLHITLAAVGSQTDVGSSDIPLSSTGQSLDITV